MHTPTCAQPHLSLTLGSKPSLSQGDVKKLVDDIGALRPTLFTGVPRVFERIYNGVMEKVRRWGPCQASEVRCQSGRLF
jgi:long-subunit acyl-CoA synthetase (AMP-forming)